MNGLNDTTLQHYHYAILIQEHLDENWSAWFDGMTITYEEGGDTMIAGPVADQSALQGLLAKVRNLNLTLLSVQRLGPVDESAREEETSPPVPDSGGASLQTS